MTETNAKRNFSQYLDWQGISWDEALVFLKAHMRDLETRRQYAKGWRKKHRAKLSRKERIRRGLKRVAEAAGVRLTVRPSGMA